MNPRRFSMSVLFGLIALSACGGTEDAAEPISFSFNQSSRSATAGLAAGEATSDAAMAPKMGLAPYSVKYVVEGDLPALDDDAQSWKSSKAPTKKQMTAVARALGVEGDLEARPADQGGGFVVGPTDGSAPSLSFNDRKVDPANSWYYSAAWEARSSIATEPAATPSDSVSSEPVAPDEMKKPENLPTKDEARDKAKDVLDAAGVDVRDDDFEVYADDWGVSVTAWLHVGSVRVPYSWSFGFGENGKFTWASGNLLDFDKGPKFPRVGATAAVERLGDPKYSGWYGYGAMTRGVADTAVALPEASVGAATKDAVTSDTVTSDSVAPIEPVVQEVVITGVKESLTSIFDTEGVAWLVPSYEYTVKDGYTVSVLAITDEFIDQTSGADTTDPAILPTPATDGGGSVSGSSGGSDGSSTGGGSPAVDVPALSMDEAQKLVGLAEDEATKVAESNGWIVRVGARDGEQFSLTMDFVSNRVTLTIEAGKVTGVAVG